MFPQALVFGRSRYVVHQSEIEDLRQDVYVRVHEAAKKQIRMVFMSRMYELLTLKGVASYYDVVMQLCEAYREKLDPPAHATKRWCRISIAKPNAYARS